MTYENIWDSTKVATLVTWSVMFSFGLSAFLSATDIVNLNVRFEPVLLIYFFGLLHSSVFAVSYMKKSEWSYSEKDSVREALINAR